MYSSRGYFMVQQHDAPRLVWKYVYYMAVCSLFGQEVSALRTGQTAIDNFLKGPYCHGEFFDVIICDFVPLCLEGEGVVNCGRAATAVGAGALFQPGIAATDRTGPPAVRASTR